MKHRNRTRGVALAACLGVAVFTGCSAAPDLDDGAARGLQDRVAAARELAAEQDYPGALAAIDQLGQEVATAADQGLMSEERRNRIDAAVNAVKADLEAASAAATPPPAPAGTPPADGKTPQEDAGKEAEKRQEEAEELREEAEKRAEEQLEEAQKRVEEQLEEAQKRAEKGKD